MNERWKGVGLMTIAIRALFVSIPVHFLAMMGFGMSAGRPHIGLGLAFLLGVPPLICIGASIGLLLAMAPVVWTASQRN